MYFFVSCNVEEVSLDSSEIAISSELSVEASNPESESSEEKKETWTETSTRNIGNKKEVVTIEYFDYGDNWTKTTKTYDEKDVLRKEITRTVVNREVIKGSTVSYDENGVLTYKNSEEIDGEITKQTYEYFLSEFGVHAISETHIITESDTVQTEKTRYLDINNGKTVAETESQVKKIDSEEYTIENYVLYSEYQIACKISKRKSADENASVEIMYDADGNEVCYYAYNKITKEKQMRYPTDNGYLQLDIADNVYTYYVSTNGADSEWVARFTVDADGKPIESIVNDAHYTADEANKLLKEWNAHDKIKQDIINSLDYVPTGAL